MNSLLSSAIFGYWVLPKFSCNLCNLWKVINHYYVCPKGGIIGGYLRLHRLHDFLVYLCTIFQSFLDILANYGALKHLEDPLLYPSRYEIEKYGLTPQGKEWGV